MPTDGMTDGEMCAAIFTWLHPPHDVDDYYLGYERAGRPDYYHDEAASGALLDEMAAKDFHPFFCIRVTSGQKVYHANFSNAWKCEYEHQVRIGRGDDPDRRRAIALAAYECAQGDDSGKEPHT